MKPFDRRNGMLASVLVPVLVLASQLEAVGMLAFEIVNNRTNLEYSVGELASFTVRVSKIGGECCEKNQIVATLDNFGPKKIATSIWNLADTNVFTVSGRLFEPGFMRLSLTVEGVTQRVWSVAYDPSKIVKGSMCPDDFDSFWEIARGRLAHEVPEDVQLERVPELSTTAFEYFRLSCATFGRRVFGYMSVPTNRKLMPYPVQFEVAAAGFGDWTNKMIGSPDRIKVFFSVYPWAPHWNWRGLGLNAAYEYMERAHVAENGPDSRYCTSGIADGRESYFYYPVILGIDRAVDWVLRRPDVDKSRIWYQGTSQGGGFGLILAGLSNRFTKVSVCVPAMTDTMGYLRGRQSGWPQLIERQQPQNRCEAAKWAPYFDAANFAARIACPVRVVVGFSDTTCAPCAVYAAYNEIKSADKAIAHGFGMGHLCLRRYYDAAETWFTGRPAERCPVAVSCDVTFENLLAKTIRDQNRGLLLRVDPNADVEKVLDVVFAREAHDWIGFEDVDFARLCQIKRRASFIPVTWILPQGFDVDDAVSRAVSYGFDRLEIGSADATSATLMRLRGLGFEVDVRNE